MSTRRYATVIYGYNLPCDFKVAEKLDPDWSGKTKDDLDIFVDGMSGEYFLIGRTLVNVPLDSEENSDAGDGPFPLGLMLFDRTTVGLKLKTLFPKHPTQPQTFYVTRYV